MSQHIGRRKGLGGGSAKVKRGGAEWITHGVRMHGRRGGGGAEYSFKAYLSHLPIDHRRNTVPTLDGDASNIYALTAFLINT